MTPDRVWLRAALVGALTLVVGLGMVAPAAAENASDARAAAEAAEAAVQRLQPRVDAAVAAYEQTLEGLARDVTAGITANQVADRASRAHDRSTRVAEQRLRALYMAGGQAGLLASVLDAQSPSDLARRIGNVRRVVAADQDTTRDLRQAARAAAAVAFERGGDADSTALTVGEAESKLLDLNDVLDEAQSALDALDERARSLEEAERAAAALATARAAADAARWNTAGTAQARGIPVTFLALYRAASATCPGLPWPVLAAIGQVESGHGSNPNDSSAGAQGPMQFLPSTFRAYAVDGDGDGQADIRNPADAIYSAANYLCANGAGKSDKGLLAAIWRYNHADWYVAMVLRIAGQIAERFSEPPIADYAPRST